MSSSSSSSSSINCMTCSPRFLWRSLFFLVLLLSLFVNNQLHNVATSVGLPRISKTFLNAPASGVGITSFNASSHHARKLNEYPDPKLGNAGLLVHPNDYIYRNERGGGWDTAPVVIQEYKLVFFTVPKVACTTFKFLFRRMMGYKNFMKQDAYAGLPHDPQKNGIPYLWDFTLEEANHFMTSPEYTRAIFLREPLSRFASSYFDKAEKYFEFTVRKCCRGNWTDCGENTPQGFLNIIQTCTNPHWEPHTYRMETKYWKYVNFIGNMNTIHEDGERLLELIGAGRYLRMGGWGGGSDTQLFKTSNKQNHVTNSYYRYSEIYTPELKRGVREYYKDDYANTIFRFHSQNDSAAR